MTDRAQLLAEAYRRGLLPPEQKAAYEEAQRRGLVPGGKKRPAMSDVNGFLANVNRGTGVTDELAAGVGVVTGVLTGRRQPESLKNPFAAYKEELAFQRGSEDQYATERPRAAALAKGTGMAASALVPAGNTANVFAQGVRGVNAATAVNAARGATLAGGQAALYAAADRGTAGERLGAASRAARDPATLALGAVSGVIATPKGAKKVRVPKVDPDVEMLAREGVAMTPGQMGGRVRRTAEDAGTSLPLVGDAINARRTEGVESFNRAVLNRPLKPLGQALPDDIQTGTDAVKYVGDVLSRGYDNAMPGVAVRADPGFADDVRSALSNIDALTPDHQTRLQTILDQRVTSRLPPSGEMDGQLYKQIQSELDWEAGRFMGSGDPDQRAIGEAIEGVQKALEGVARRQDPAFARQIDALDRGWAELARIESAASKSRDLSGVFTPAQYAQSIKGADGRVRKRGVARGEAMSQDLARAGVRVLPSKMPDSGTAGRAAWGMVASAPGAVIGAVTGGGVGALAGIGGTAATLGALSRAYTPEAVQAANVALSDRISAAQRREALQALAEMAAKDPRVAELQRQVAARLARAAGVAGGAQAAQPANIFAQP